MRDYTDYRGSIEENEKKLWNKEIPSSLDFDYDKLVGYKKEILRNLIMKSIGFKEELKILDISTNKGFFAMLMSEEGHDVVAIDSNMNTINSTKDRSDREKLKIEFRVMDKSTLDFNDKTFDLIISSNITWDIQSPVNSFKEWRRVLKDNGTLVYFDSNWDCTKSMEERPYLDRVLLNKAGFSQVKIDEKIYSKVFKEEGVSPYNPRSIFMVAANK